MIDTEQPRKPIKAKPERVKAILQFISDSRQDYIAARTLFLAAQPKHAAILASTAIEKALKALLAFHGKSNRVHLGPAHWNLVKRLDPRLKSLNDEFLALNQKLYVLRYSEAIPPAFTLTIPTREFLAELDEVLLVSLYARLRIAGPGAQDTGEYWNLQPHYEARDRLLFEDNHVLNGIPKQEFINAKEQLVYAVHGGPPLFEIYYMAKGPSDGHFMRVGVTTPAAEPAEPAAVNISPPPSR